jgi:hypothetical protein
MSERLPRHCLRPRGQSDAAEREGMVLARCAGSRVAVSRMSWLVFPTAAPFLLKTADGEPGPACCHRGIFRPMPISSKGRGPT